MSGFLGRLVDRAAGPPAAAVSPRVGPVFGVRPPGRASEPAFAGVGADEGLGARSTEPTLAGRTTGAALRRDLPAPLRGGARRDAEAEVSRRAPASALGRITPAAEGTRPNRPQGQTPAGVRPSLFGHGPDEPLASRRVEVRAAVVPDDRGLRAAPAEVAPEARPRSRFSRFPVRPRPSCRRCPRPRRGRTRAGRRGSRCTSAGSRSGGPDRPSRSAGRRPPRRRLPGPKRTASSSSPPRAATSTGAGVDGR